MKILHLCLANFYIDNYNYQENILPRIHNNNGHEVRIVASTETFVDNMKLGYVEPAEYKTEYGVTIKRLPYQKWLPHIIMRKLRYYPHVLDELTAFEPDIIMMHDASFGSVRSVARYMKKHPQTILYVDTHTDANNSGLNWISRTLLHRLFYRSGIKRILPFVKKYLYLSKESKFFSSQVYGVPNDLMEFYPLGGVIPSLEEREDANRKIRLRHGLTEQDIIFVHSGKMDALKRTEDILSAFAAVPDDRFHLFLIGSFSESVKATIESRIEADVRVSFLGWKNGEELQQYLCACDLYLQPGSQSATMQMATCCGAPTMLYPHESHFDYDRGNIFFVKTVDDMAKVFKQVAASPDILTAMKQNALDLANDLLDYDKLADRICR